jgi:hypothetical protein
MLHKYEASAGEDILIARWWVRMYDDGDIDRLFTKDAQTLASLLRIIAPPKVMLYAADESGIWFAMWFEQMFSSLVAGMWTRADRRRSRETLDAILAAYDLAFTASASVLGITKQPELLRGHRKLGYRILGAVPHMWDGDDAWIVVLTRGTFQEMTAKYRRGARAPENVNGFSR